MFAQAPSEKTVRSLANLALLLALVAGAPGSASAEELFKSRRVTPPPSDYRKGIEGPAVDAAGNLHVVYVVNFKKKGTIGRLRPGADRLKPLAALLDGSIGNGIRFDCDGRMYVADYVNHKMLVFEPGRTKAEDYFHSDNFNQPNDLAIADDGTLYASDPPFGRTPKTTNGRIWRIVRGSDGKVRGEVMASGRTMGQTNGLDLSPDGKTLYVSESATREIWAYRIDGAKLADERPVKKFDGPSDSELDGLRTDVDGRIYVTRPRNTRANVKGTVAVLIPDGTLVRDIPTNGRNPSNLTFGGPDGKTVFVTQGDGGFIESFRVDRPGREPCLQVPSAC